MIIYFMAGTMQRRKIITAVILIFIMLACFGPASAQERGFTRGHDSEPDITTLAGLDLTMEQRDRIKLLQATHLQEVRSLRNRIRTRRHELRALWLEITPDREKIGETFTALTELREQMLNTLSEYHEAVFQILTPQQQAAVQSAIQKRLYHPGCRWEMDIQNKMMRGRQ
jgi:Spy/CpxP family protein refolding chaperone